MNGADYGQFMRLPSFRQLSFIHSQNIPMVTLLCASPAVPRHRTPMTYGGVRALSVDPKQNFVQNPPPVHFADTHAT